MSKSVPVAILIPCHNAEAYLEDVLENVLSLTYPHLEIIVCDDASDDGSREILGQFNSRMRILENPRRLGVSATRNRLLRESSADYIHFHDDDDLMKPYLVEVMLPWLETGAYDVVAGQVANFYNDAIEQVRDGFPVRPKEAAEHPFQHYLAVAGHVINKMYRRGALEAVGGFREDFHPGEDFDLDLRLAVSGARLATVGETVVYHRCRETPRTFTHCQLMINAFRSYADAVEACPDAVLKESEDFRRVSADRIWHMGRLLSEQGAMDDALVAFEKAREIWPGVRPSGSIAYQMIRRTLGIGVAERLRVSRGKRTG